MCIAAAQAGFGAFQQGLGAGMSATSKEALADNEAKASAERASRLYFQGQQFLAEQRLQTLSNGIEGGSGSALEVGRADAAQIELDALTELYGGQSKAIALREEARLERENSIHGLMKKVSGGVADLVHGQPLWGAFGKKSPTASISKGITNTSGQKIFGY